MTYLFAAYCFVWVVLFGYLRFLQTRLSSLQKEIALLKASIEKK